MAAVQRCLPDAAPPGDPRPGLFMPDTNLPNPSPSPPPFQDDPRRVSTAMNHVASASAAAPVTAHPPPPTTLTGGAEKRVHPPPPPPPPATSAGQLGNGHIPTKPVATAVPPPPPPPTTRRTDVRDGNGQGLGRGGRGHGKLPHPPPPRPPPPRDAPRLATKRDGVTRDMASKHHPRPPPPPPSSTGATKPRQPAPPRPGLNSVEKSLIEQTTSQNLDADRMLQDVLQPHQHHARNRNRLRRPSSASDSSSSSLPSSDSRPLSSSVEDDLNHAKPSGTSRDGPDPIKPRELPSLTVPFNLPPPAFGREMGDSDSSSERSYGDPYDLANKNFFPPILPADNRRTMRNRDEAIQEIAASISRFELRTDDVDDTAGDEEDDAQELWSNLKERRQKLNDIRRKMALKRRVLREARRWKDEVDNAFMSLLRPILVKSRRGPPSTSDDLLEKRLADMLKLRTDYGWLESEYEGLETMLDEEEIEQDKLETRFFSMLAVGRAKSARLAKEKLDVEVEHSDEPVDVPLELRGISMNGPSEDMHPLWQDLLSALGDLQNAKEEHDDILLFREQVDYDVEVKRKTGQDLSEEEWEFLNEYPAEEREKKQKLERYTAEVARLKQQCLEKGVMRKHPPFYLACMLDPTINDEDMTLETPRLPLSLAHCRFPLLLSQPEHLVLADGPLTEVQALKRVLMIDDSDPGKSQQMEQAMKEFRIFDLLANFKDGDKSDYVTRWLLYQLQTSPLAAELLFSVFEMNLKVVNPYTWQEDVLAHWFRDGSRESYVRSEPPDTTANSLEVAGADDKDRPGPSADASHATSDEPATEYDEHGRSEETDEPD